MKFGVLRAWTILGSAAGAAVLAACNQSNQVTLPPPGTTPFAANRIYVTNFTFSSPMPTPTPGAYFFSAPFGSSTVPGGVVTQTAGTTVVGAAVDPNDATGTLYIVNPNLGVSAFSRPTGSTSTANFTILGGMTSPLTAGFDSSHDLFVADGNAAVWELAAPITSGTTPTALSVTGLVEPVCVALDGSGDLFVLDVHSGPQETLEEFAPSHSGAPTASTTTGLAGAGFQGLEGCAYDSVTRMIYVANANVNVLPASGAILGYATPLTLGESPTTTIAMPANTAPFGITFDAAGNLYADEATAASGLTAGAIAIYRGPVSSASTASTTIPNLTTNAAVGLSVAVGP